jgi:hypothetical protein
VNRAIRGALAHNLFGLYGLSLTADARDVLAEPLGGLESTLLGEVLFFATKTLISRLTPAGFVWAPTEAAYETLLFGRACARYLEEHRAKTAFSENKTVLAHEARALRKAIERALVKFLWMRPPPSDGTPAPKQLPDHRGRFQKVSDSVLLLLAKVPEHVTERMDDAFDEVARGGIE